MSTAEPGGAPLLPERTCGCGARSRIIEEILSSSSFSSIASPISVFCFQIPGDLFVTKETSEDPCGRLNHSPSLFRCASTRSTETPPTRWSIISGFEDVVGAGASVDLADPGDVTATITGEGKWEWEECACGSASCYKQEELQGVCGWCILGDCEAEW